MVLDELPELLVETERGSEPVKPVLQTEQTTLVRMAELGCRFHERIENRLQVKSRAADGLEHFAGRRLIGQGFGEFVGAGLNLLIEPSELLGCLVDVRGKRSKLVPIGDGRPAGRSRRPQSGGDAFRSS